MLLSATRMWISGCGFCCVVLFHISQLCSAFAEDVSGGRLKPVTASLLTKWTETPLLLEASEFFYDESPSLFWAFLEQVKLRASARDSPRVWTDKVQHDLALDIGKALLSPIKQNFLQFSLALRYYSARIEMYRQIMEAENVTSACIDTVVDLGNGVRTCGLEELKGALDELRSRSASPSSSLLMSIDHHHSSPRPTDKTVIVYGNILRPGFWWVHDYLLSLHDEVHYVFRHYLPLDASLTEKVRLPGYGVELAIKSTEYKAQDDSKIKEGEGGTDVNGDGIVDDNELDTDIEGFDFGKLKKLHGSKKEQLEQLKSFLMTSTGTDIMALKAWQFQDMSYQAAERVLKVAEVHGPTSTDSLKTLRDISQNFPTQAPTLLKIPVRDDVRGEIERNREFFAHYHNLEAGGAAFFINGLQYDTDLLDAFVLFEKLREENSLLERLHGLGIRGQDASSILELDLRPSSNSKYGVDFRHPAVNFINDLEKDSRYSEWSSSVRDLIRHTFPPTLLKSIRKNFYNLILVADPSESAKTGDVLRLMESFYVHKLPIRLGIVFVTNADKEADGTNDISVALYDAFKYAETKKSPLGAVSFMTDLYQKLSTAEKFTVENIIKHFKDKYPKESAELVFGAGSPYEEGRHDGRAFVEKLNLGEIPVALMNGVALDRTKMNMDEFENEVLMEIVSVYSVLQRDVQSGELTDYSDVVEHIMGKPTVVPRLNSQILSPSHYEILEFGGASIDANNYTFENFEKLKALDRTATMSAASFYLSKHEEDFVHPVTFWVVGDPETSRGRDLFYTAVKLSKTSKTVRVGFIYNPVDTTFAQTQKLTKAIQVALETQTVNNARNYVTKLLKEENVAELNAGSKTFQDFEVNGMDMTAFNQGLEEVSIDFLKIHTMYAQQQLGLKPGENGIVANGFVIGPLSSDFGSDDLLLLEKHTGSYGATKLAAELDRLHIFSSFEQISDVVMMTSAVLSGLGNTEDVKKRTKVVYSEADVGVLNIEARDPEQPAFDIIFIVDPLSREAQKVSPILMVLHETLNCRIRIFFNCRDKLSELPLKTFYRLNLESRLLFTDAGAISPNFAVARFASLPQTALLTMNLQAPENWLAEATYAIHDLDNIKLSEVNSWGVHGQFELRNLLLEGSAKDHATDQPPRGTQFILGTPTNPSLQDTIVMANLGYFQLKASPGVWIIRLREGRSRDIYSIASAEGAEKDGSGEEYLRVLVSSFSTKMMVINVKKRPGMEREDVLSEATAVQKKQQGTGILDSITSYWSGEDDDDTPNAADDVINIFSLASGHLYERFLRLMMLSVIKNTQTPVKFWFLKNYLSPQFKEFLPYMANHYKFQYELVEYKWPRWLHRQSEKQRLIWGYKILFLDVLFPLSVKKIIFVDADQIVRADMKELRDLDLQGAPYGYTPFCDSRTEMEGFRFWKNGYWATHLGHRKYHISALYVVDLVKFRKIAAGDRLRAQYQGLSQDPNSLSNLDQDLPNNMIFQVPIKSLPQEWLWCETWCDDQSKPRAKTIDLCNNPETKEPKLTAAMRIIPEWKSYDDEVRVLLEKFHAEKAGKVSAASENFEEEARENADGFSNEVPIHSPAGHEHGEL